MICDEQMTDSMALTGSRDALHFGRIGDHAKRVVDVVVACALIAFTLPLMAIVALAIKCDSRGSVLYRQERVGLAGRRFMLLKFRSMVENAEADGKPVWAAQQDARVTAVGRVIRLMRIDELPQLVNVLWGDMSMVGPRPERPHFVEQLNEIIPHFAERQRIKPGIFFFDALRVKIRDEGLVRNKPVHIALGVRADGTKEILGLWLEQNEGAKFWLRVMSRL
jgi:lipopolysaccharide/colanic/teichoic acid biosynthesis glycosyltransferase